MLPARNVTDPQLPHVLPVMEQMYSIKESALKNVPQDMSMNTAFASWSSDRRRMNE